MRGTAALDIAVDAHVHLHAVQDLRDALAAAARNFAACSKTASRVGVLMIADPSGEDSRSRLASLPGAQAAGGSAALWFDVNGWRLLAVPGRQVVTAEGIEVLALCTQGTHEDGLALDATLDRALADEALVVLPWGCGKWWGRRGGLVRAAIACRAEVFLGDNGGRPAFWRDAILAQGVRTGRPVLPGSDPLPLDGEAQRLGSRGFVVSARLPPASPVAGVKAALRERDGGLRPFGTGERALRFVLNQWRLRRQRGARRAPWTARAGA